MYAKASGSYAKGSTECTANAKEIYAYLAARGWTLNAVAGVLGNIWAESGMNPWRWQDDIVRATTGSPWYDIGYGFFQITNAGIYINMAQAKAHEYYGPNFSNKTGKSTDGITQLYVVDNNLYGGYIMKSSYPLSFSAFKASTASPSYLAAAWLVNFERPQDQSDAVKVYRGDLANYFYNLLSGSDPDPDPTPTPDPDPDPSYGDEYLVTVGHTGNGTVTVSPSKFAKAGSTVNITVQANGDDSFENYTVMFPSGLYVALMGLGVYSFTMPDNDVFIMFRFTGSGYSHTKPLVVTAYQNVNARIEYDTQDGGTVVQNIKQNLDINESKEYIYNIGITDPVRIYVDKDVSVFVTSDYVGTFTVGDENIFFYMPDTQVELTIFGLPPDKKKHKSSIYYIPWWKKYGL